MSAYINPNEVKTDAAGILKVWAANRKRSPGVLLYGTSDGG